MLILEDRSKVLAEIDALKQLKQRRIELRDKVQAELRTPEAKAAFDKVISTRSAYVPFEDDYIKRITDEKKSDAKELLLEKMKPTQDAFRDALEELVTLITKEADQAAVVASQDATKGKWVLVTSALIALIIAVVSAWVITLSITTAIDTALKVSDEIAKGNLRNNIPTHRGDELGNLMRSLDSMQTSLRTLVGGIQNNANELAGAAQQMAGTAEQVAIATQTQSEAASSMAASVEEMTVSVNLIADNARQANAKTMEAGQLSATGHDVVIHAGNEMQVIADQIEKSAERVHTLKQQSNEISSIAEAIRHIAEQTNLLALNAAIEAARAGEQGRGFAVVADAVRALAERTSQSTSEITETISKIQQSTDLVHGDMEASVARAKSGLALAKEAEQSIEQLSAGTDDVVASVNEISNALKEQTQTSSSIAKTPARP
jgi:methyl-accepting chemotaxis protein